MSGVVKPQDRQKEMVGWNAIEKKGYFILQGGNRGRRCIDWCKRELQRPKGCLAAEASKRKSERKSEKQPDTLVSVLLTDTSPYTTHGSELQDSKMPRVSFYKRLRATAPTCLEFFFVVVKGVPSS